MEDSHTTIRIKKEVKEQLARLDFVVKEDSYNDIILKLINQYHEAKGKIKRQS